MWLGIHWTAHWRDTMVGGVQPMDAQNSSLSCEDAMDKDDW